MYTIGDNLTEQSGVASQINSHILKVDLADMWMLILEALVFIATATFIFLIAWKVRKNYQTMNTYYYMISNKKTQISSAQQVKDGVYYKIIFFDLLWITCTTRALGAIVMVSVTYTQQLYWLFLLMSSLPNLLLFTTFSLFIYFFAKIVTEEETDSTNLLKPFFIVFNTFTYAAFIFIAIYSKFTLELQFIDQGHLFFTDSKSMKAISGLFGVVYLIFSVCMTNYGIRLSLILSNVTEHAEQEEKDILKPLNIRVLLITILLTMTFAIKACYNLLYTWGLIISYYPQGMNPIFWDCIVILQSLKKFMQFNFCYEFLPCLFILLFVFNDNQKSHNIEEDNQEPSQESEEMYGNFNPNLNAFLLEDETSTNQNTQRSSRR